jgi:FtsP/CotA-like multicopper oxidase with cupredoxin domain
MPGLDYTDQPVDYDIYIPTNHPSGQFWIHPHVHGLSLNQINYGMAGVITIGAVTDNLVRPIASPVQTTVQVIPPVRYVTLKDMEILSDSTVLDQADPDFCAPNPDPSDPPRNGFCPGVDNSADDGGNYLGGKWIFSVNGQVFPTITLGGIGEIWRITHASASRSYQLSIDDDATGQSLPFQVLAIDGVSISSSSSPSALAKAVGGKFTPIACPPGILTGSTTPICAKSLRMMPSSRIEIFVPPTSASRSATFLTRDYPTGPAGDDWPYALLAHVVFSSGGGRPVPALNVIGATARLLSPTGLLNGPVKIDGGLNGANISLQGASKFAAQLPPSSAKVFREHLAALSAPSELPSAPCVALPPGHHRRIFFGTPPDNPDAFGLGYEEIDQYGKVVPGTFRDIQQFDHAVIDVCLPLAKGNTTVNEPWELINVAGEDHNFHIHQTKFRVLVASSSGTPAVLVDNTPVPHGSDPCDGSIGAWRSGACKVQPVNVFIPFSEVGDFVYHCHILEHEDGGMMAHIRVVPNP